MTNWLEAGKEPAVDELLDDEVTQLVLARDGLGAEEVRMSMREARQALRRRDRSDDAN